MVVNITTFHFHYQVVRSLVVTFTSTVETFTIQFLELDQSWSESGNSEAVKFLQYVIYEIVCHGQNRVKRLGVTFSSVITIDLVFVMSCYQMTIQVVTSMVLY